MFRSLPYAVAQSSSQPPAVVPNGISDTFSSTLIILFVLIFISLLFIFFIAICIHHSPQTDNDVEDRISRKENRGLDPAVIETFPIFAYSHVKDHKLGNGALECVVCLNEFVDEDTIRLLPKCDHVFHPDCIDAWLSKHTTCPVCRANLVPVPGETHAIMVPVQEIEGDSDGEIPTSEPVEAENEQVYINVLSEEPQVVAVAVAEEVINETPMQNRPARLTKPRYVWRFSRSNSTGHSLVQPGEDVERFTLRLPDDMRKQIMTMRQVNRTRSMVAFAGLVSPKNGYRSTDEGSSRGRKSMGEKPEGWVFSMTAPFFMRSTSPRSPKMLAERDAPVASPRPKPLRSPLRVCTKVDETETVALLTRSPV
ncbi:RING-H2 finger protein ATL38-like [Telopea speciosissima]|uniref:RING-H2 finger protein ATL38-like n=1 Tax=Telopea speciosissima TaxID=54955 RepID=UPI001CC46B9D|nr:RING-H2 finger protein ATL38-like [Telopea speciosissima]